MRATLKSNPGLKALNLEGILLFDEDFRAELSFKLKKYEVLYVPGNTQAIQNFLLFLKSQMNSLETLSIGILISAELLEIILSMPRLEHLKLMCDISYFEYPAAPRQNYSITRLELCNFSPTADATIESYLLPLFPKVEHLAIRSLNHETAELIPESCKFLKTLIVGHFTAERIESKDFYLGLEKFVSRFCETRKSKHLFLKLNGDLKKDYLIKDYV